MMDLEANVKTKPLTRVTRYKPFARFEKKRQILSSGKKVDSSDLGIEREKQRGKVENVLVLSKRKSKWKRKNIANYLDTNNYNSN